MTDAAVSMLGKLDRLEGLYVLRTSVTIERVREFEKLRTGCWIYYRSDAVGDADCIMGKGRSPPAVAQ